MKSRFVRYSVAASLAAIVFGACVGAGFIYRLPPLGSERRSNAYEVSGERLTVPGESGFWIAFPTDSKRFGHPGGDAEITWLARKGILPVLCHQGPNFESCWGEKLSTIEGGNWNVDHDHYQMVGRLYFHYKPVPRGTAGSILVAEQAFSKDSATCAGDYMLVR